MYVYVHRDEREAKRKLTMAVHNVHHLDIYVQHDIPLFAPNVIVNLVRRSDCMQVDSKPCNMHLQYPRHHDISFATHPYPK